MFLLAVIIISFLILGSSIYFWPDSYGLTANIKDTLLNSSCKR